VAAGFVASVAVLSACGSLHGSQGGSSGGAEPQPRSSAAMAWDARAGELLLFGGVAEKSLGDTWAWHDGAWRQLDPPASPPARENAALGYDGNAKQLVLFGGDSVDSGAQVTGRNDTWTWDGSTWTERHPAHRPPASETPQMAWDEQRNLLVLVTQPAHPQPQMGKDSTQDQLPPVLTWTWRDGDWHQESAEAAPLGQSPALYRRSGLAEDGAARPTCCLTDFMGSAGMAWDPASRRVVYVEHVVQGEAPLPKGGLVTWTWDGAWHLEHPALPPGDSAGPLLAADATGVVLIAEDGATWHWNGSTWRPLSIAIGPGRRTAAAMAAGGSSSSRRAYLFGGIAPQPGGVFGDTWTWDGTAWSHSAGPAQAQPVPQIAAAKPAHGISREEAIAKANQAVPHSGPVTAVADGPLSRFDTTSLGAASQRTWVWAVVFGTVEMPAQGGVPMCDAGTSCPPRTPPPPSHGLVVFIDYQTGRFLSATSPAPAWLIGTPSPSPG